MELFDRAVYSAAQDSEFVGLYGMELGAPDRVPGFHAGHFFEPKPPRPAHELCKRMNCLSPRDFDNPTGVIDMNKLTGRICAAAALACTSLVLANIAEAVDLRDWGRQFNTASERFVLLAAFNNWAVLDKETQLVWHRVAGPGRDWATAVIGCHGVYVEGRLGWRLPSMSELRSVLGTGGVLPVGHPFQGVSSANFWTSTDSPSSAANAFTVNLLNYQGVIINSKNIANQYLCVRGPGVADR